MRMQVHEYHAYNYTCPRPHNTYSDYMLDTRIWERVRCSEGDPSSSSIYMQSKLHKISTVVRSFLSTTISDGLNLGGRAGQCGVESERVGLASILYRWHVAADRSAVQAFSYNQRGTAAEKCYTVSLKVKKIQTAWRVCLPTDIRALSWRGRGECVLLLRVCIQMYVLDYIRGPCTEQAFSLY